jgi:enediyne polyketide synthase
MRENHTIAICSLSCRFPDARSPQELWRNLMHGRRSFRPIPTQRLPLAAYHEKLIGRADSITRVQAGLVTNWRFDRQRFRVPKSAFENTDLTHWLALELAAEAIGPLDNAGGIMGERTAVVIANTLAGEFSRSALLRLRRPFLDELLEVALQECGTGPDMTSRIREAFSTRLRNSFPDPTEDSLAGGLANTIAGRIANHFDFHGGAYTVDGACSSSLIAVANAAEMLESGAADTVVAGAVDLSLDPFELVGFSRNGALSPTRMRVFDERSDGFWPGEGGAVAVMMREADARDRGLPVLATLRGWGLSTDGAGGLTRPARDGQYLACRRAYEKAGVDPADLTYVEAHGTGTVVGDLTEIEALADIRGVGGSPLPVGSAKANIGHTKAAAGFAGLVKVIQALREGVIPPHVACEKPHRAFAESGGRIAPLARALELDASRPVIAGVSSFGFGGINAHVVIEANPVISRTSPNREMPFRSVEGEQAGELYMFQAENPEGLRRQIALLHRFAATMSIAECTDLAAHLARRQGGGPCRLAFVASGGEDLARRIAEALAWLDEGGSSKASPEGLFASLDGARRDVCLLFSGQAAPVRAPSPVWLKRFPFLEDLAKAIPCPITPEDSATENAQPAITFANLTGLAVLNFLGVAANGAIGHSLGELSSLVWAGSLNMSGALELAHRRGLVLVTHATPGGAMARIAIPQADSGAFLAGLDCAVACLNGPEDIVISGSAEDIRAAHERAAQTGIECQILKTSHAFHSRFMDPAVGPFDAELRTFAFAAADRPFVSTVDGRHCAAEVDIRLLLSRQLVQPVRFAPALRAFDADRTIFVECGPGAGLARLARNQGFAALALDSHADNLSGLLESCAALYAAGQNIDPDALFGGRGTYPFDGYEPPFLLANPCGSVRMSDTAPPFPDETAAYEPPLNMLAVIANEPTPADGPFPELDADHCLELVVRAVSEETGLPAGVIGTDARFQSDLHMNSLAVTRVVIAATKTMGLGLVSSPTDFADATPRILSDQLSELARLGGAEQATTRVGGVRPWFAPYGTKWHPAGQFHPGGDDQAGARFVTDEKPESVKRLYLPDRFGQAEAEDLIATVRDLAGQGVDHLEVVHQGAPISAFLRSAFQENAFRSITLIDCNGCPDPDLRIDDICTRRGAAGFAEYRLEAAGAVSKPRFERIDPRVAAPPPVKAGDVILAIGCHRGIGAECAMALAQNGATLVFAGRSPASDTQVEEVLALARERAIDAHYVQCDVGDLGSVERAARSAVFAKAMPSVLLHAPAVNIPASLAGLDRRSVRATLTPKCNGLEFVLASFGAGLRRLIAFGSIIGQIGLQGESHYALANALQSRIIDDFGRNNHGCACLSVEWTVWSGAGMGERLGTIERLHALGVDALPFDEAISIFKRLADGGVTGTVCMTGRFGNPPGLELVHPEHPPLRFAERMPISYPGSEVVLETEIHRGRDPYLRDHIVDGRQIFPGVMALEAMAQAVTILSGEGMIRSVHDIEFKRAVTVSNGGTRIRIAAQLDAGGSYEAALFCDDDGYAESCFRARFETGRPQQPERSPVPALRIPASREAEDASGLYGTLFFHGRRFARLSLINDLRSRYADVALTPKTDADFFGRFEPQYLALGDPSVADAAMHMLQLTIPHRRVLPVSIGRIRYHRPLESAIRITGTENWSRDGLYCFDLVATDKDGNCVCEWTDARFRAISSIDIGPVLDEAPWLGETLFERIAREKLDDGLRVAFIRDRRMDRQARREAALRRLDLDGKVLRRADGRPLLGTGAGSVGLSHADTATLAVLGSHPVACDIAALGSAFPEGMPARRWSEGEVLRKLGMSGPFGFGGNGAAPKVPGARVASEVIAPLGVCVAFGTLDEGAGPTPAAHEMEWEGAK